MPAPDFTELTVNAQKPSEPPAGPVLLGQAFREDTDWDAKAESGAHVQCGRPVLTLGDTSTSSMSAKESMSARETLRSSAKASQQRTKTSVASLPSMARSSSVSSHNVFENLTLNQVVRPSSGSSDFMPGSSADQDLFSKFFQAYFDISDDGKVAIADVIAVFETLGGTSDEKGTRGSRNSFVNAGAYGDHDKFIEFLSNCGGGDGTLDCAECAHLLMAPLPRTCCSNIALVIMQLVLPFLYSTCTRLPFICVALEVMVARQGTLGQVGCVLGVYQTCRALANAAIALLSSYSTLVVHTSMVLLGLAGWTLNLLEVGEGVWGLFFLGLVGLSECVVCMQQQLLAETSLDTRSGIVDSKLLSRRFRTQYAAISFGSCFAYVCGGWLYVKFGYSGICYMGVAVQGAALFCIGLYCLTSSTKRNTGDDYDHDTYAEFKSMILKLTAIDEIVKAVAGMGPSWKDIKDATAASVQEKDNVEAVRDFLKQLTGESAVPNRRTSARSRRTRPSMIAATSGIEVEKLKASLLKFLKLSKFAKSCNDEHFEEIATGAVQLMSMSENGKVTEADFMAFLLPRVYLAFNGPVSQQVTNIFPYLYWVIVTQAVMALCIGAFLSTAALLYDRSHGLDTSTSGLLLGVGEGLGVVVIFTPAMCRRVVRSCLGSKSKSDTSCYLSRTFSALASRPLHVPMVLLVVGAATVMFSHPHLVIAAAAQMTMSSVNDLSVTLLNELIVTSTPPRHFKRLQAIGQWLRRLGNMVTGFTGPLLFGVVPHLPFVVYGSCVFVWAFLLWIRLYLHAREIAPLHLGSGPISAFAPFTEKEWHTYERDYIPVLQTQSQLSSLLYHMDAANEKRIISLREQVDRLSGLDADVRELREVVHSTVPLIHDLAKLISDDVKKSM